MERPCVFCDRSQFEERLIGETSSLYFIATLGQITDGGYTLIIPKRHVSCLGAMEGVELVEVDLAMRDAANAIDAEYGTKPLVFEHGIVGQTIQHAHLHLLPTAIDLTERIRKDYPDRELSLFSWFTSINRLYGEMGEKYLLWNIPARPWLRNDGVSFFRAVWDPPAPPQYLRIVAAELIGRPERANWRNMDPELDKRLWTETVRRLKKYFS